MTRATLSMAAIGTIAAAPAAGTIPATAHAKMLFCAVGSIGTRPAQPPPGFESQFAAAVVEIDSTHTIRHAAVTAFVVRARGAATAMERVVSVERFDGRRAPGDGRFAYYLNERPNGPRPWNGTVPRGRIRLRVRVALRAAPPSPQGVRCSLAIGPYSVDGPLDGVWPT